MEDKVKITLRDGTTKIIKIIDNDLIETYKENNINQDDVVGIDKVGV